MTSKVIIRIGEESQQVEKENLTQVENFTYANDNSVLFANVDIYYVIITENELIQDLIHFLNEGKTDEANSLVRNTIVYYVAQNYTDFSARVEKAIKTAHGVGVKKAARKVMNSLSSRKGRGYHQRSSAT